MAVSVFRAPAILNWAGSKGRVARRLCRLELPVFGTYHEPFLGSGAVFLALAASGRVARARLSDLNPSIVNLFMAVRSQPQDVISGLRLHALLDSDVHFAAALARLNGWRASARACMQPDAEAAADTVYLLSRAFHSAWHEARDSHVTMTRRHGARPFSVRLRDIPQASVLLQGAEVAQANFRAALAGVASGDFVFLDPPYLEQGTDSDPQAYNAERFTRTELAELSKRVARLVDEGSHVVFCWGRRDPSLVPPGGAWFTVGRDAVWLSAGIAQRVGTASPHWVEGSTRLYRADTPLQTD